LPGKGPRGTAECKMCGVRKPKAMFIQKQANGSVRYLKTCSKCREELANSTTVRKCIYCKHIKPIEGFRTKTGNFSAKSCVSCRKRILSWKKQHPELVHDSYKRHSKESSKKSQARYYANREEELKKRKISRKKQRLANPEAWKAKQRGYQKKWLSKPGNKEKRFALISAWMRANRAKMNAAYKRWYVKNQAALRQVARQRSELYGKSNFSFEQWLEILDRFGYRCAYCLRSDVKLTMDHVIPLSCGGKHEAENIVPACKPCNSKKGNRPVSVMFKLFPR